MYATIWTGRVAGDVEARAAHAQRDAIALADRLAGLRSLQVVLGVDGALLATAAFDDLEQAEAASAEVAGFLQQTLGASLGDAPPTAGGIVAVWIAREIGEPATYASGQPLDKTD
ncbi:MAG TPA: hypothetical protein VFQ80_10030 [Thermomicrobiales bacterium]|jgi:hypothetical protein|nr:hypothetical protein [Thermomicrobiales bacterium]